MQKNFNLVLEVFVFLFDSYYFRILCFDPQFYFYYILVHRYWEMRGSHLKKGEGREGLADHTLTTKNRFNLGVNKFLFEEKFQWKWFFFLYEHVAESRSEPIKLFFFIELDFGFFKWLENVLIKVENWFIKVFMIFFGCFQVKCKLKIEF